MQQDVRLDFVKLKASNVVCEREFFHGDSPPSVALLRLNRPAKANAMSAAMLTQIPAYLDQLKDTSKVKALVITGTGKNFCAGADLEWMRSSAELSGVEENCADAALLSKMYKAIYDCEIPTVAIVDGAAYGGGVGLAAVCDYVVTTSRAKFCLSETRIGLLPAVILPYVMNKISESDVAHFGMTAEVFDAETAKELGLVRSVSDLSIQQLFTSEVNKLCQGASEAQKQFKKLCRLIAESPDAQSTSQACVESIASQRASQEGQSGLQAFLKKQPIPWAMEVDQKSVSEVFEGVNG